VLRIATEGTEKKLDFNVFTNVYKLLHKY